MQGLTMGTANLAVCLGPVIGGLVADWFVKNKGMKWRKERIEKTSEAKRDHGDGEEKRGL